MFTKHDQTLSEHRTNRTSMSVDDAVTKQSNAGSALTSIINGEQRNDAARREKVSLPSGSCRGTSNC